MLKVKDIMNKVLSGTDSEIPDVLEDRDIAKAFYGITINEFESKFQDKEILQAICAETAISADDIIQNLIVVDWQTKIDIPKKMVFQIGDYLIDDVRDKYNIELNFSEIDRIAEQIVEVAKIRYK